MNTLKIDSLHIRQLKAHPTGVCLFKMERKTPRRV